MSSLIWKMRVSTAAEVLEEFVGRHIDGADFTDELTDFRDWYDNLDFDERERVQFTLGEHLFYKFIDLTEPYEED